MTVACSSPRRRVTRLYAVPTSPPGSEHLMTVRSPEASPDPAVRREIRPGRPAVRAVRPAGGRQRVGSRPDRRDPHHAARPTRAIGGCARPAGPGPATGPAQRPAAGPVRLTPFGRVVTALVLLVAVAALGWRLGVAVASPGPAVPAGAPASVIVRPGDTLWGIAARIAPEGNRPAVVRLLEQRNRVTSGGIQPGQMLWVQH